MGYCGYNTIKVSSFSLISKIFINIGDFAIHIFLIMNIRGSSHLFVDFLRCIKTIRLI